MSLQEELTDLAENLTGRSWVEIWDEFHTPAQRRARDRAFAGMKAGDPEARRLCMAHLDWMLDQPIGEDGEIMIIDGQRVPGDHLIRDWDDRDGPPDVA